MNVRFWCEFPEKVNWKNFKKLVNFETEVYVTCKNREEFNFWKKKIKNKFIDVGAWPVLSKEEGYWFSGFLNKKSIDKLKEFNGLKIKIDIEPPFPGERKNPYLFVLKYFFINGENNNYLNDKINGLSKNSNIIVSGFPLPLFLRKKYGHFNYNTKKNYIAYTTFSKLLIFYYSCFIKKELKKDKDLMIGLGCIGKGIFSNEPVYKSINEFKKDLEWVKKLCVKNISIFEVSGLMDRKDRERWFKLIKDYV